MRISVVVGSLFVAACASSPEAKPVEVVSIPQPPPSASAKPLPVATNEPASDRPGTLVTSGGPAIAKREPRKLVMKDGEVDSLERLIEATSKTSPDRPALLRRLGDAAEALARSNAGTGDAAAARQKAIVAYTALVNDYPSLSTLDEVLYYLALSYELSNDLKKARARYYDLISKRPDSRFIPHAYFAFGEMFFEEAAKDPSKLDLAVQAYTETLKYPPQNNALFAASLYRLGRASMQKGDQAKSREFFARLDKDFRESDEAKLPR